MLKSITHFTWQVLRAAKRSRKPLTGLDLRVVPSRHSKDGTFFDKLVEEGLLEVVGVDPLPVKAPASERNRPFQFRTRYKLTQLGEHAAEYGEYDKVRQASPQV